MKRILCLILFTLSIGIAAAFSQELRLVVVDKPLNTVLNTLGIEISYDDKALSAYRVSVSKSFRTPDEALNFLLKDKPFKIEKVGNVYVVLPEIQQQEPLAAPSDAPSAPRYIIKGVLVDRFTDERLPYAYIHTQRGIEVCDQTGTFSLVEVTGRKVPIQIQYLGYNRLDTLLSPGTHVLSLTPQTMELEEVVVQPGSAPLLIHAGKTSGEVRLNHQVARHIPGSPDNSVFNLLRMMPGVRASGEPSDELIVWGSNVGESRIEFDGLVLFGMKNFNEHISSVNPYLVKDVRLLKGGYDATHGNRIDAIAQITGISGNTESVSVKASVSNYTANVYASVPMGKRASLSAAYRQTYYNLYDKEEVTGSHEGTGRQNMEVYIKPRYSFKDLNLKYAGKTSGGDSYYISLYGADDRFRFSVTQTQNYEMSAKEKNRQYGGVAFYEKVWSKGSNTQALISFSKLSSHLDHITGFINNAGNKLQSTYTDNSIQENTVKLQHRTRLGTFQSIRAGAEWKQYTNHLNAVHHTVNVPSLFVTNQLMLGKISVEAGLRATLPEGGSFSLQPRISARYTISDEWTATASGGIYNQFISRVPYAFQEGNYQMIWSAADSTYLKGKHAVAGLAYNKNGWLVSVEGYFKHTHNGVYFQDNTIYFADNTVWGGDIYVKKEWGPHTGFASYSLVNIRRPSNDLGHEWKAGMVSTFGPFHVSATYIFGTGFSYLSTGGHNGHGKQHNNGIETRASEHNKHAQVSSSGSGNYNRLDVAASYTRQFGKCKGQIGLSLLNVFNARNVKYNYRLSDKDNVANIYAKAAPFTPMIFIEFVF